MRILLVNPDYHCGGAEVPIGTMTPLGLLLVAGALIDRGHEVELLDASKRRMGVPEVLDHIRRTRPEGVGVGAMASTATTPRACRILEGAKQIDPSIFTVLGGVHPSYMYNEIMEGHPSVDAIVRGDGEWITPDLVDAVAAGSPLRDIQGIVWRSGTEVVVNPVRPVERDLESLRAAWELIDDWDRYRHGVTGERMAVVQFSRGCPFTCSFCGQWEFWVKYRTRDPIRFVDELEMLNRDHGVTHFFFADEEPAITQGKWIPLLEEIARRKLDVHLSLNLRVTDILRDRERLDLYRRAGIVLVDLGVESTDQAFLDEQRKKTTTGQNAEAIALLRQHGIMSIMNLLLGGRSETQESLDAKFSIIKRWGPDLVLAYILVPFPWTSFGDKHGDQVRTRDYEEWNYVNPVIVMDGYDQKRMVADIQKHIVSYHTRRLLSLPWIKDPVRRRSVAGFILGGSVYYYYHRLPFLQPLIRRTLGRGRPMVRLFGPPLAG